MNKICTFTQTYSNNRKELFDFHNLDENDIKFRNLFETNFYSFHNCSDDYVNEILSSKYFKSIQNLEVLRFNNISYTETFRQFLNLINNKFEYFVFLQDDCFTLSSEFELFENIFNYVMENNYKMLNLERNFDLLCRHFSDEIFQKNDLCVYNSNSDHFRDRGLYAFDDGPYVARVDYVLEKIYDETYFSMGEIWPAENYLNDKVNKSSIQRLTTNNPIYRRYNILGINNWNRTEEIKLLNTKFGI